MTTESQTFSYTGTVVDFTVTTTGTYDITADGAQGGAKTGSVVVGGNGAEIGGDFALTAGETLEIVVGGAGQNGSYAGGGGGGSFVIETFNGTASVHTPLVIAGGGGGGGYETGFYGYGGRTSTSGGAGRFGGAGGSGGHGGAGGGAHAAGGGGGYIGGAKDASGSGSNGSSYAGGPEYSSVGAAGGFGGGGAGYGAGGGGGGYGGGGGGGFGGGGGQFGGGGGGGSFDGGTNQVLVAGTQTGNGLVTIDLVCFLAGTRIATPEGERAVESLHIGDLVTVADGSVAPVKWVGRRTLHADGPGGWRHADPLRVMPIRIRAGALGHNLPARDLLVSPAHGILIDGLLVSAGALVNGMSVLRESRMPETFTFYHVELADHALLLAEGAAAETFLDGVEPLAFDNWQERAALYPDGGSGTELAYPRVKAQRQVPPATRQRLIERARRMFAAAEAVAA